LFANKKKMFSIKFVNFLNRFKILIIILWLLIAIGGGYLAPKFMENTTNVMNAPKNSLAHQADIELKESFPQYDTNIANFVLFIFSKNNTPDVVLSSKLENFTLQLNNSLREFRNPDKSSNVCKSDCIISYLGYYTILNQDLPQQLADAFVSKKNTSTILSIAADITITSKLAVDFSQYIVDQSNKLWIPEENIEMQLIGKIIK
jgi:hypothetical protein